MNIHSKLQDTGVTDLKKSSVELSIIIVHYKTKDFTLDCLKSIFANPPTGAYEIIVLDNGSNDGIREDLTNQFPAVRFMETGSNMGFAKANNLGIQNSRGDYILLLNSDTRVEGGLLQELADYMQFHPEIGVLGPRHIEKNRRFVPSCGKFPSLINELVRKIAHYQLKTDDFKLRDYLDQKFADREHVDWVSGSCLMVRRKALKDSGLLDERFFMYFEDIDFCKRVQRAGWKICYYPNQSLIHYGGQSAKHNILKVMYENRKSQLYFSRIYFGRLGCMVVRIVLFFKYSLSLVTSLAGVAASKIKGKSIKESYAKALISKKVIVLTLRRINRNRKIAKLQN